MPHHGGCFCGAVAISAADAPVGMGFCHCASCRGWLGAPLHGFTMWPAEAVTVTAGADKVATFLKTPGTISHRQFCTVCGGAVMVRHPGLGLIDVPSVNLPTVDFVPQMHVNYAEHVLPIRDGLPKFKGFPPDFGGSDETLPE
jgi:hypothetical protein